MGGTFSHAGRAQNQKKVSPCPSEEADTERDKVSPFKEQDKEQDTDRDKVVQTRPHADGSPKRKKQPEDWAPEHFAWTEDAGNLLQDAVDRVFGTGGSLLGLEFSFTIADPFLDDCPLIGCSAGFTTLCGYESKDIVGRNCRFLIEHVPPAQLDHDARRVTKDYCMAIKAGKDYVVPLSDRKPWTRADRPGDELVMMQTNSRKDGSIFNNLFYMKAFELGAEMGEGRPYIVAVQSELKGGYEELAKVAENLEMLEARMRRVKNELASMFFMDCSMSREVTPGLRVPGTPMESSKGKEEADDKAEDTDLLRRLTSPGSVAVTQSPAPTDLSSAFTPGDVQSWDDGRFKYVRKLCEAPRNKGVVQLMRDQLNNELVAIKQMPNTWLQTSHEEFIKLNPTENELPWQDIGCTRFLNSVNFKYACKLEGVYRGGQNSYVAAEFASEGDLFGVATGGPPPGLEREANYAKLAFQLCTGMKQLHNMHIAHRDMSLENVLLTAEGVVKIIDYAMASTKRVFQNCVRGKQSYQAPEMHLAKAYDSFLAETFSVGVMLYSLFVKDYPWLSTNPGVCKNFAYVRAKGFRGFLSKRKLRGSDARISDVLSEPLMQLLEGMLAVDPERRLTFGEDEFPGRRSVWDEPWMKQHWQHDEYIQTPTKDSDPLLQEPEYQDSKDAKLPRRSDPKVPLTSH